MLKGRKKRIRRIQEERAKKAEANKSEAAADNTLAKASSGVDSRLDVVVKSW